LDGQAAEGSFSAAFDQHAPAILRYARRRLDGQDAAWDIVSDTFTAAWRHWARRPPDDQLLPWLYAIAANSVRDKRRSIGRQNSLVGKLALDPAQRPSADPADEVVSRQVITTALSLLPEADREVLRLVAWDGVTDSRALGAVLGLRPGAARARVHRARRRLRAQLAAAGEAAPDEAAPSATSSQSCRVSEA
jgi:RNA polymerase sigma factor (sigma-70 family)